MTIKKLPDSIISRIAAGEVIVAPSNAVKELLENALDAKSTSISVQLNRKTTNFIIRDNGEGIEREDLEFLCLNHYTSKLQSIEDFKNNYQFSESSTFGFRGEALHSLSLCSHLKVYTKRNSESETGFMATYYNGNMIELKEVAYNERGSTFEVKDIFYNNMIRSVYFEKNKNSYLAALDVVKCYGIIFNSIECFLDEKVVIKSDSNLRSVQSQTDLSSILSNRKKYIYDNFNTETLTLRIENLISFHSSRFNIICSDITVSLKKTKFILFVNQRLVRDTNLMNKVLAKYKKIKSGIYPFIFIEIVTDHVDVNVHPEKAEVFIENMNIFDEIVTKIGELLTNSPSIVLAEETPDLYKRKKVSTDDLEMKSIECITDVDRNIKASLSDEKDLVRDEDKVKNSEISTGTKDNKNELLCDTIFNNSHFNMEKQNERQSLANAKVADRLLSLLGQESSQNLVLENSALFSDSLISNNDTYKFPDVNNISRSSIENTHANINSQSSFLRQESPYKIYSSPLIRRLDEQKLTQNKSRKRFSLTSLRDLQEEIVCKDPNFIKNLVFVGVFENFIFAQHQSNLIKIEKKNFLFQVFYQKFIRDFGNFECFELDEPIPISIDQGLHELLKEYFSLHIESDKIIAIPKVFDVELQFDFSNLKLEKFDEIRTIKHISEQLAMIYSKIDLDLKLFNKIKMETTTTIEVIETFSLLVDLRELYKGFDRC